MWIARRDYDRLQTELTEQRTKREAAETSLALTRQTVEWFRVQVNTLQYERASLLAKITGAPVMVPTVKAEESSPISPPARTPGEDKFLSQMAALFDDVGDETAQTLGITHADDGTVVYTK